MCSSLNPLHWQQLLALIHLLTSSQSACAAMQWKDKSPVLALSFCHCIWSSGSVFYPVCLLPSICLTAPNDPQSASCLSFPHLSSCYSQFLSCVFPGPLVPLCFLLKVYIKWCRHCTNYLKSKAACLKIIVVFFKLQVGNVVKFLSKNWI